MKDRITMVLEQILSERYNSKIKVTLNEREKGHEETQIKTVGEKHS